MQTPSPAFTLGRDSLCIGVRLGGSIDWLAVAKPALEFLGVRQVALGVHQILGEICFLTGHAGFLVRPFRERVSIIVRDIGNQVCYTVTEYRVYCGRCNIGYDVAARLRTLFFAFTAYSFPNNTKTNKRITSHICRTRVPPLIPSPPELVHNRAHNPPPHPIT